MSIDHIIFFSFVFIALFSFLIATCIVIYSLEKDHHFDHKQKIKKLKKA